MYVFLIAGGGSNKVYLGSYMELKVFSIDGAGELTLAYQEATAR
jgi:hypothetical protein